MECFRGIFSPSCVPTDYGILPPTLPDQRHPLEGTPQDAARNATTVHLAFHTQNVLPKIQSSITHMGVLHDPAAPLEDLSYLIAHAAAEAGLVEGNEIQLQEGTNA